MKHTVFSILFALIVVHQSTAQQNTPDDFKSFSGLISSQYASYFSRAELDEYNRPVLYALEKYVALQVTSKSDLMNKIVSEWNKSFIVVNYNLKRELWGQNDEKTGAILIYSWDSGVKNSNNFDLMTSGSKSSKHPFFVYAGGQGVLDSEHNLNATLNTRVGFFLLKNKWDLAWVFSGGLVGNIDASMNSQIGTGLMSKYYFPIPRLNISPNVGVDLMATIFTDSEGRESQSASRSILAGISWYVGPGSLDAGVRIRKEPSLTIGYTLMPGQLRKK